MDPPGNKITSLNVQQEEQEQQQQVMHHPSQPQPFEIALIRKIESKTNSVRDAFILLDIDGDGRISPTDVRTVLHNELGLDITSEQEEILFHRSNNMENESTTNDVLGMKYSEFAKYFQEVSSATLPASVAGSPAAVGFHRNERSTNENTRGNSEMSIHLQPATILHQKRRQLQQLFTSHSTRDGSHSKSGSGMKETSLFLAMDTHRSGKVTMQELLDWLNTVGVLGWGMDDLRLVVLGEEEENTGDNVDERKVLEKRWFGGEDDDGDSREAGMTEHEFAEFVESLDSE